MDSYKTSVTEETVVHQAFPLVELGPGNSGLSPFLATEAH